MSGKNNGKINKKKRVLFLVVIFVSTIIGILLIDLVFKIQFKITEIGKEQSPNGKYVVEFQMIGEPKGLRGPANIKIVIKSTKGDFNKTIETKVYNGGTNLVSANWEVNWSDDTVEIIIQDKEPGEERFNVPLE